MNTITEQQISIVEQINNVYTLECEEIEVRLTDILNETKFAEIINDLSLNFYYNSEVFRDNNCSISYSYGVEVNLDKNLEYEIDFNLYDDSEDFDLIFQIEILQEFLEEKFNNDIEYEEAEEMYLELRDIMQKNAWDRLSDFSKDYVLHRI